MGTTFVKTGKFKTRNNSSKNILPYIIATDKSCDYNLNDVLCKLKTSLVKRSGDGFSLLARRKKLTN